MKAAFKIEIFIITIFLQMRTTGNEGRALYTLKAKCYSSAELAIGHHTVEKKIASSLTISLKNKSGILNKINFGLSLEAKDFKFDPLKDLNIKFRSGFTIKKITFIGLWLLKDGQYKVSNISLDWNSKIYFRVRFLKMDVINIRFYWKNYCLGLSCPTIDMPTLQIQGPSFFLQVGDQLKFGYKKRVGNLRFRGLIIFYKKFQAKIRLNYKKKKTKISFGLSYGMATKYLRPHINISYIKSKDTKLHLHLSCKCLRLKITKDNLNEIFVKM